MDVVRPVVRPVVVERAWEVVEVSGFPHHRAVPQRSDNLLLDENLIASWDNPSLLEALAALRIITIRWYVSWYVVPHSICVLTELLT